MKPQEKPSVKPVPSASKYEVTYVSTDNKITCPVCNKAQPATSDSCLGCGHVFKKKVAVQAKPSAAHTTAVGVMSASHVEAELKKLMSGKKQDLKLIKEQIQADERRIHVMKVKLDAKVKIFDDQRQRYQAKIEILEKDLAMRKSSLEGEEKKVGETENQLVQKLVDLRKDGTAVQEPEQEGQGSNDSQGQAPQSPDDRGPQQYTD
jgi:hypothetical protein